MMERIASFEVDHRLLEPGVYLSTELHFGAEVVTTFDLRMTAPYREPVLSTGVIHAIEHLGATYLRKASAIADRIIYFGPMGCRTGFYVVVNGACTPLEIVPTVVELFRFIRHYEGAIPGATMAECGNCRDMDLPGARAAAARYLDATLTGIDHSHLHYPAFNR